MTDMPFNNEAELSRQLRSPTNPEDGQEVLTLPMAESISELEYEGMTRSQALNLYTSHFLSTWNVRTYEFAAVSASERQHDHEDADNARSSSRLLLTRILLLLQPFGMSIPPLLHFYSSQIATLNLKSRETDFW